MKGMKTMSNDNALDKFIGGVGEALERLQTIREYVENHLDVDAENVRWVDVSTISRVNYDLNNLMLFLCLANEDVEEMTDETPSCPPSYCGTCIPGDCLHNQIKEGE
jgi:hypothetical protein